MKSLNITTVVHSVTIFLYGLLINNRTAVAEPYDYENPTYWCPEGLQKHSQSYYCYSVTAPNLPWNTFSSCLKISSKKLSNGWESRCSNFTDAFLTCEKKYLGPGMYTVDITGKGIKNENGLLFPFGSFYVDEDDSAIVCGVTITSCKPLEPELLALSRIAANGSVIIADLSIVLDDRRYFTKNSFDQSLEHVCLPLSKDFIACDRKIILELEHHAWIQKDWTLLTDLNDTIPYDTYILLHYGQIASCFSPPPPSTVIGYAHASSTIASVIRRLLDLVLHQLVTIIIGTVLQ